jgi:endonuclease/exonuclease/phosphatase family metal-dependent hydrolase
VFALKLMTYNIRGQAAARRPDHIAKIAEVIAGVAPDIVGLQEVHCGTRAAAGDQAETLARLTGLELAFGRSCSLDGGDYGNAVLTRGTVTASEVFPLPGAGEPRSLMRTDVQLDGTPFSFFVTHLAAWGRLLRRARLAQIASLGDITAEAKLPHVLVGDFNVSPRAEEIRLLMARGHLRPSDPFREVTFPMTRQRLDYVFCDPRWSVTRTEVVRRGPSDHWPVVVELRLEQS